MRLRPYVSFAALVLLVFIAYSNHFGNSFHFDDAHTIEANVHVRSLSNIPRFFTDARTFSNLPTHQVYRPLLTTSIAVDYVRGGGKPSAFHATSFAIFLALIWVVWQLYMALIGESPPLPPWTLALAATSVFALHPVIAETVNYIIQRGDLLSTLGVAAALLLYVRLPHWRRFGLYLLPLVGALLVKPPALVFPILLFAWVLLFEEQGDWRRSARAVAPSLLVCAAMGAFLSSMTVGTFNPGGTSAAQYRITQMYAAAYYFLTFFAPVHLTADSDWTVLPGISDPRALIGLAFLLGIAGAVWFASRRSDWKPVAFGLIWFLAALFPTSWMPLAEVVNDHRMFFPFVGLSLSAVLSFWLAIRKWWRMPALRYAAAASLCLVLAAEARATWQRNEVWRSEETLWRDAVAKSPANGRALMNYALTLMGRGASAEALVFLERAHQLIPNYAFLEINLGIAKGMLSRPKEAEAHFRLAEALEPRRYESHFFYGRWLREQGRTLEALDHLRSAVEYNPYALDARHLYMQLLAAQQDWPALDLAIAGTLQIAPDDPDALRLRALSRTAPTHAGIASGTAGQPTTADGWVDYALLLYQAGKFRECIDASRKALQLKPDYAAAWNNIAAAHNSLREWDAGIRAAEEALRLRPDFDLARNNRDWAVAQRARP